MAERTLRRAFALSAVVLLCACGISAVGTFSDGDGGGPDASPDAPFFPPTSDASSDTTSGDASNDVSNDVGDAGADALLDAADAADAFDAGVTFCKTLLPAPTFCDDFDNPSAIVPTTGWNGATIGAGSTLLFGTSTFVSSPRSLHATTTLGNESYLEQTVAMTTTLSVDFRVRFASLPADGDPISPIVLTPPNPPGEDIHWFVDDNNSYFQEFGTIGPTGPAPAANVWHQVTISLTTNGTTTTASSSVDGTPGWNNSTLPFAWPANTNATIRVGAARVYANANDVYIDNVIIKAN